MLENSPKRFPFIPPTTKESYYYREVFEKHFKGHAKWIPYRWMPKWCGYTDDPSARALKHYKQSDVDEDKKDIEVQNRETLS